MALIETPAPTSEELRAVRRARIGATGAVLLEAQRRLRQQLPAYIAELNEENNWDGRHSGLLPVTPKQIRLAPTLEQMDASCKHSILLRFSNEGSHALAGRVLAQVRQLVIYSVDDVFETDEQILRSIDRAEAAATILSAFHGGCNNAAGITVWKTMKYSGVEQIPPKIARNYAGARAFFEVEQTPHANGLAMP